MSENPYAIPQSNLTAGSKDEDYSEIRFFSSKGRIGRLRYISYVSVLTLLALVVGFVAMAFMGGMGWPSHLSAKYGLNFTVLFIPFVIFLFSFFVLNIQRLHDADYSGWLAILLLVPVFNIMIIIALMGTPGTAGRNKFGPPPPPNTLLVKISSTLFILFWVLGQTARFIEKVIPPN